MFLGGLLSYLVGKRRRKERQLRRLAAVRMLLEEFEVAGIKEQTDANETERVNSRNGSTVQRAGMDPNSDSAGKQATDRIVEKVAE